MGKNEEGKNEYFWKVGAVALLQPPPHFRRHWSKRGALSMVVDVRSLAADTRQFAYQ